MLILAIVFGTMVSVFAQETAYEKAMKKEIVKLDQADSLSKYKNSANAFSRISQLNPNEWQPYYYEALAYIYQGLDNAQSYNVKELFGGTNFVATGTLNYTLSGRNASIFRFQRQGLASQTINFPPIATTILFSTSETSSRKPKEAISENDKSLLVINFFQPLLGTAFTFQIKLMLSCISMKIAVAPTTSVTTPIIRPIVLLPLKFE